MKSTRRAVTAAFALLVMLTPVFGQSAGLRVDVPFKFVVGKTNLAAGEYKVTVMKPGMLQLQRTDGGGTASFMTSYTGGGPYQDRRERLVFHTYGVPGSEGLWSPRWSPDGSHIVAFSQSSPNGAAPKMMLFTFASNGITQ